MPPAYLPSPHADNLHDDGGINGDTFLNRIQSVDARVPYMTTVGNHEPGPFGLFNHYRHRFAMPRSDTEGGFEMWWSMDIGPINLVAYSTEVYFEPLVMPYIGKQLQWLQDDFASFNKQRADPSHPVRWLVAIGHRPMYCSNTDGDDCTKQNGIVRTALEEVFHRGGVDVVVEAHEHSYERTAPLFNYSSVPSYDDPPYMVHLVSGAAGCNEDSGACLNPIAEPRGNWSIKQQSREGTYSYGRVTANQTAFTWTNVVPEMGFGFVEDSVTITQHRFGPRG